MKKKICSTFLAFLSILYSTELYAYLPNAPAEITNGEERMISVILIVGALILWFMPTHIPNKK
jgi:hypothetical protein